VFIKLGKFKQVFAVCYQKASPALPGGDIKNKKSNSIPIYF